MYTDTIISSMDTAKVRRGKCGASRGEVGQLTKTFSNDNHNNKASDSREISLDGTEQYLELIDKRCRKSSQA